jgi:group I intron endonuclease
MIIYKTKNLINGKIYIGQDLNNNVNYLGSGLRLNNAIKKYGIENFEKEIIEYCKSKEELNEREKFWIKKYNAQDRNIGYNIADGGTGGRTWQNYTDPEMIKNTKEKRSIKLKERNRKDGGWSPDPLKRKASSVLAVKARLAMGYKHSDETKAKIGASHKGKVVSDESRKNISKATKEAMKNIDMKALYKEKVEGKLKIFWSERREEWIKKTVEMITLGDMKYSDMRKELNIAYSTFKTVYNEALKRKINHI